MLAAFLGKFPNDPYAVWKSGQVLFEQGRYEDAVSVLNSIDKALWIPQTNLLLAEIYQHKKEHAKARALYRNALTVLNDEQSYCLYANYLQKNIYGEQDVDSEVINELSNVLNIISSRWPANNNSCKAMLADCYTAQKKHRESIELLESIRDKNDFSREENLTYQYLSVGNYKKGFKDTSVRNRAKIEPSLSAWLGMIDWFTRDQAGSDLIILSDQGVGDQILLFQLMSQVASLEPSSIILACEPRLQSLFSRSLNHWGKQLNVQVVAYPDLEIQVNQQGVEGNRKFKKLLLSDLPFLLDIDETYSNSTRSYLVPDAAKVNCFKEKYSKSGKTTAGISWFSSRHPDYKRKNIALTEWQKLLGLPDYSWVSLQYGEIESDLPLILQELDLILEPDLNHVEDIESAVAQVAAMELVVTVSTTCAHFAGALGIETYVLTPFVPLWYWSKVEGDDISSWYPSVHVVSRSQVNDVASQFTKLIQKISTH